MPSTTDEVGHVPTAAELNHRSWSLAVELLETVIEKQKQEIAELHRRIADMDARLRLSRSQPEPPEGHR